MSDLSYSKYTVWNPGILPPIWSPVSGGVGASRNSLPVSGPVFSVSGVELHPIQALAAAESASTPTRREIVRTVIIPSKGLIRNSTQKATSTRHYNKGD